MKSPVFALKGNVVQPDSGRIFAAEVVVSNGRIDSVRETSGEFNTYLLPGFVDAHVHIESSMLTPIQFARTAVTHGTVATVSDPHEIANVMGIEGVRYILENASRVPMKFHFGAPSCVPSTEFETSGARLNADDVAKLLDDPRISYLSEMMNYPGALRSDPQVLAKIDAAIERRMPIDGHAPGLRGKLAARYFGLGISTDHECSCIEEAREKIDLGVMVQIRQGSAARNFEALLPLLDEFPDRCMLCSDDKHPDDLLVGHVDQLARSAVEKGVDVLNVLKAACTNPVRHYGLNVGQLKAGDPADFIEVDNLSNLRVLRTFIDGCCVARNNHCLFDGGPSVVANRFGASRKSVNDFRIKADSNHVNAIAVDDGQLVTRRIIAQVNVVGGNAEANIDDDLLKVTVVNRYADRVPAVAFVKGFGLHRGAIATSVAHDCHNIIAVGTSDEQLRDAVNLVISNQGGLAVVGNGNQEILPLPIAGLMSTAGCEEVATQYARLNGLACQLGSNLRAPLMTLSFMALLVIPEIKLSDRGLFDGKRFEFIPLFA